MTSGSGCYCRLLSADGKGRGSEEAGDDVDDIENEAEGDRFLGGNAKRDEEEDKGALSNPEAGDPNGENLKDQNCWVEGEKGGESEPAKAKGRCDHEGGNAKHNLVNETGDENRKGGERLAAQFSDALMNGIDE